MDDPDEHALVMKALMSTLSTSVLWYEKSAALVRSNRELKGMTPEFIKRELLRLVRSGRVTVKQVVERRPNWQHYKYYYKAILPFKDYKSGLFVEMRLSDSDEPGFEFPVVVLVGAHP